LLGFAAYGITDLVTIGSERVYPPSVVTSRSLWGRLRRWTYGRLTAVAAQTSDSKCWLQSNTLARTVAVIPNPVEWPLPIHGSILGPSTLVSDGTRLLLAAGRLEHQKGFDWLIDVFATLSKKHQNWILVILGDGPQRKALEKQIENRQMRLKVFLAGVVGNMAEWYSTADLYVLSSRFEGFPNTLVEALSYGLPAISFDCDSGPRDIIRNEIDGLLVPVGDLNGLTSALDKMMSSETIRRNFAERAREVRERFSINRVAEMWEALFKVARSDG
jgi:glycosyltransferase involved in cell wall biosynthesis